jgi:hypothetical protein
MVAFLITAFHDESGWLILACLSLFGCVVVGSTPEAASAIGCHPYEGRRRLG